MVDAAAEAAPTATADTASKDLVPTRTPCQATEPADKAICGGMEAVALGDRLVVPAADAAAATVAVVEVAACEADLVV